MTLRRTRLARWRCALVATVTVMLASCGAAAAHGLPRLLTEQDSNSFAVRPLTISYTGDGTGIIGRFPHRKRPGSLDWKTWTRNAAYAVGTIWLDDCTPDCARGIFHPYNGSVRADHPRSGVFTRITLHFRYHGRNATDIRALHHNSGSVYTHGGYYEWVIVKQTGFE
jgi:hypothetical protein